MENIAFIFTPIDFKYRDADTHYAPPLGLVALENYLYQRKIKSTIIDGSVKYTFDEILSLIRLYKPRFVGQSVQLISYKNALKIAEVVHSYGGINVFGGHHATQMCDSIMLNQHELVDYVIFGDGEDAWHQLVTGNDVSTIPNLVWWNGDKVCYNEFINFDLANVPPLDYSRVDLTPYIERLAASEFAGNAYTNYLRIYSHKGCGNRNNGNACIFCGRADSGIRFKTPELYWKDIIHCVYEMKGDFIFDVGDDLLYSTEILRRYVETMPAGLHGYEMGVFGRANRVNDETSSLLRQLGVSDVTIGFETGDDEVMRLCNKLASSPTQNMIAADCLSRHGIGITASYVLGMPGECDRSLANTIRNAEQVVNVITKNMGHPPTELVANLLEPTPGSPAFKAMQKKYPDKYLHTDYLDLEEMQRDYFYCFFDLQSHAEYISFRKKLAQAARSIHSLVPFSDSQGWLSDEL